MPAARVLLGVIGRPHGVRGLVRVVSYTDPASALAEYGALEAEDGRRFTLRWRGEGLAEVAALTESGAVPVADRTAAERLTNLRLFVPRARLPAPEPDEYYLADLVGLAAVDPDGAALGTIAAVHDYGAGASLEIARPDAAPLLVPFSRAAVPEVDVAGGRLVVAVPDEIEVRAEGDSAAPCGAPLPRPPPARGGGVTHDTPSPCGRGTGEGATPPGDASPMTWRATVLTLFPEMFPGPLGLSLAGRALEAGRWSLAATDIRAFATDRHRTVDDTPFGGGAGMVLRPDVADAAIAAVADGRPMLALTPRGRPFTQADAVRLAAGPGAILLCGRYEGIDQRVIEARALEEVSIGDYVLSGGELAAMVLLDAAVRLLPGVMGAAASAEDESFSAGLLEYPHYTRPAEWHGRRVPDVLLSGHHAAIAAWRRAQAETVTRTRRPDLWARHATPVASRPAAP